MNKYDKLWDYVQKNIDEKLVMTFDEIASLCGAPVDHSFLTEKKALDGSGIEIGKISMKQQTVIFRRRDHAEA